MEKLKLFFVASLFLVLLSCNDSMNSKIVRRDLLKNIDGFIEYSEENAGKYGRKVGDTNIYWVEFFEKNHRDVVIIMQQPYYHSQNNDGFIELDENLVFFHFSNKDFVDVSKLEHTPPNDTPDENSRMAGLGYSAPNWAYYITENGLEKFELGE
ncbi:hypothetical protein KIM67_06615 [Flagellimonas sp. 389]|nr:hypothetical protein [uncultured Allomuricauda sp.]MBS9462077.1 hypothetical protein [Flagellimonas sp. 389]